MDKTIEMSCDASSSVDTEEKLKHYMDRCRDLELQVKFMRWVLDSFIEDKEVEVSTTS